MNGSPSDAVATGYAPPAVPGEPRRKRGLLWTDVLLAGVGAAILIGLMRFLGTDTIGRAFAELGWAIVPLTLLYGAAQASYAYAWTLTFPSQPQGFSFIKIFGIYLAGDAVNYGVPSGNLAGEPVKAYLMRSRWPIAHGLASVLINKLSETASMVVFILAGIIAGFSSFSLPPLFRLGVLVVFVGTLAAVSLFFWRQRVGLLGPAFSWLSKLPFLTSLMQRGAESATEIDRTIAEYYGARRGRFALSLLFNFFGWWGGVIEVYLILKLLNLPATLPAALSVEAFSLLVNNLFFFLPGRVGGGESGKAAIFAVLGYGAPLGLSFGIIRRVRELFWVSVGLGGLAAARFTPRRRVGRAA